MDNKEWFRQAGFGMMVHFGLYSILGGEYRGRRVRDYAEWIQSYCAIPNGAYEKLAGVFNPIYFDADEWIKLARSCGMRYFVMTAKHHDGFAMYHSKADRFNVVEATPFRRDITAELAEACYKYGLKFGLYYSQELDWHHPDGGGYTNKEACAGVSWDNSWDYPDAASKDFGRCFEEKIKPQVEEILTGYGDLCLIWFDVPHTISKAQSLELNDLVKRYQPDCLINSRIGNGAYDYVSLGDNEIPQEPPKEVLEKQDLNGLSGYKFSPYGLYETAGTMNSSWGFRYYDQNWKSPEAILQNREKLNKMGVNYLLNMGPDGLGRMPSMAVENLKKAAEMMREKSME